MKLSEIACFTEEVTATADFYRHLLGSEPVAHSVDMAIFMSGSTKIFIHRTYDPQAGELPPENHIAFTVEDVDDACARMKGSGMVIENEPRDYYWGRSAYLRDPAGRLIELTQES